VKKVLTILYLLGLFIGFIVILTGTYFVIKFGTEPELVITAILKAAAIIIVGFLIMFGIVTLYILKSWM